MTTAEINVTEFVQAVHPSDPEKQAVLAEEVRLGQYREFDPTLFGEVESHRKEFGDLPEMPCDVVRLVLPTHDRQNYKVLSHYCACGGCKQACSAK